MNKQKLIYIISPSFSGSTLLTLILAQHPRVSTIGELKATARGDISEYSCSCGKPILQCPFWISLDQSCKQLGIPFSIDEFNTHFASPNKLWNRIIGAQIRGSTFEASRRALIATVPPLRHEFRRVLEQNYKLTKLISEKQNGEWFLDGSKDPNRLLYFLRSDKWDLKVIKLYRDGRAQSNSHRSKPKFDCTYADAAREWKRTVYQMERVCSLVPMGDILEMRYEDLCSNPGDTLDSICSFLKIEPIQNDWDHYDLRSREHHILGNSMRTKSHIKISLDEKWRNAVSEAEAKEFDAIAGDANRSLGYRCET